MCFDAATLADCGIALERSGEEQIAEYSETEENYNEHHKNGVKICPSSGDGAGEHIDETVLTLKVLENFEGRYENVEGVDNALIERQLGRHLNLVIKSVGGYDWRAVNNQKQQGGEGGYRV